MGKYDGRAEYLGTTDSTLKKVMIVLPNLCGSDLSCFIVAARTLLGFVPHLQRNIDAGLVTV